MNPEANASRGPDAHCLGCVALRGRTGALAARSDA
jgi:hypothetical protein